jgi:hypothetical protein
MVNHNIEAAVLRDDFPDGSVNGGLGTDIQLDRAPVTTMMFFMMVDLS